MHAHTYMPLNNRRSKAEVPYANEPDDLEQNFKWLLSEMEKNKGKRDNVATFMEYKIGLKLSGAEDTKT